MGTPNVLADIDDNAILDRIRAGEHSSSVAASLGVHKSAISHRYKKKTEYAEARETGTEVRLNDIEDEIQRLSVPLPQPVLKDHPTEAETLRYKCDLKAWQMSHAEREFNLACARERYKAASWRASVEFPNRWGQRPVINVNIDLGTALQQISDRMQNVIEGEFSTAKTEAIAQEIGSDSVTD